VAFHNTVPRIFGVGCWGHEFSTADFQIGAGYSAFCTKYCHHASWPIAKYQAGGVNCERWKDFPTSNGGNSSRGISNKSSSRKKEWPATAGNQVGARNVG